MKNKYNILIIFYFFFATEFQSTTQAQSAADTSSAKKYIKAELLYHDDFNQGIKDWVVETPESSYSHVEAENGKLIIDVDNGATVWFKQKLSGNILIEYHRKVIINNGHNDRLSDLNQFWMATDPRKENLFTRSGPFSEYDSLQLYYAA